MCQALNRNYRWQESVIAAAVVAGFATGAAGQQGMAAPKTADVASAVRADATQANANTVSGNENAMLLEMAKELKAQVDKTNKDVLALDVVREAQAIERMARKAQREMTASHGRSEK